MEKRARTIDGKSRSQRQIWALTKHRFAAKFMYLRINNSDGLPIYIDRCLYYYTVRAWSRYTQYTGNTTTTNNNNNQLTTSNNNKQTTRRKKKWERESHCQKSTKQNEHKQNWLCGKKAPKKEDEPKSDWTLEISRIHVPNGRRPRVIYYHEVAIRELQNKPTHYSRLFFRSRSLSLSFSPFRVAGSQKDKPMWIRVSKVVFYMLMAVPLLLFILRIFHCNHRFDQCRLQFMWESDFAWKHQNRWLTFQSEINALLSAFAE